MRLASLALVATASLLASAAAATAAQLQIRITVENLAPTNGVGFAPLRFGFGNGTFDAFNENAVAFNTGDIANAPIVTVAEGGSGSTWFPAFAAAEPNANLGSVTGPSGPFTPGSTNSGVFTIDTANRFFTFGAMVIPSNDHFIGNDDPQEYEVFDAAGNLILTSISQPVSEFWDAGSETENPANAAFLVGGVNDNRVNENGVVTFNFSDLVAFNGLQTAAGYNFDFSTLRANDDAFRITFAVIPEPSALGLLSLGLLTLARRRTT